ncbi:MATE family efflux transporter [Rubinisphaera margarita]|uniref:MATE family efflux transporter n=1 Tax=Rubinisphaera margarita TaxID=2909586 RepID=UPI001EE9885F|nr:polysaccharide biosynthesis C-terminal domain-containing protein [Rubinisphaera margarita]MCG6158047.1 oligosaccharide flippase family protein [Rubinisphaera margarita]
MSVKVNVLISWLAHAVTLGIGFLLMPYILHTVGDSTYGTWLLLNSIAGHAGLLYFGFGEAISRFTSKYHTEEKWIELNRTFSCITSIYLISGCIAFLLGIGLAIAAPFINDWPGHAVAEIRWTIVILALNAAISIGGSSFGGILMGIQRFDVERTIVISINILRLVLTLVFLHVQPNLLTLALIFLAVTVAENVATCICAFRFVPTLQFRFRHLRRRVYQRCLSFSMFTFLSLIAEHLIYMTDTIVIGFLLGPLAVVPYYIASRVCEMIRAPVIQVGYVFMPRAGQLHSTSQNEELQSLVCRGFGLAVVLTGSALIGVYFFSHLLIEVWIGNGYLQSSWLLLILLAGQLIALPTQLIRHVLTGTGYVRLPALLFLAEAVTNLCLSLALLPWLGVYGVAIGTLVPLVVFEGGILLPMGARHLGLTVRQVLRRGVVPQLLPLCLILIYSLLIDGLHPQATWMHVFGILVGALVVLLAGLAAAERLRLSDDLPRPTPSLLNQ